ncbi:MAG: Fic family protein [Bacteroidales bacterium]|nr:Fic family protein [Bacteroidales bacterium]
MSTFDEYYHSVSEPEKRKRYENWAASKGMQAVDGLKTSEYLDEVARKNIEGDISSYEVVKLIETYYEVKGDREDSGDEKEADLVSSRINLLISDSGFSLVPEELSNIHGFLFEGLIKNAGKYRDRNIMKHEWVLDGDTVTYGDYRYIPDNLERLIRRERLLKYTGMESDEMLFHLTKCVSDIWQVHPFPEGNTRTVAVFAIKYFRFLGFDVDNRVFQNNSWFFRNALVRANYTNVHKNVDSDISYLEDFLSCILFGMPEGKEFHNRLLHIRSLEHHVTPTPGNLDDMIRSDISGNDTISRSAMAQRHHVSEKTIERHLKKLGYVFEGPSKTGHWVKKQNS